MPKSFDTLFYISKTCHKKYQEDLMSCQAVSNMLEVWNVPTEFTILQLFPFKPEQEKTNINESWERNYRSSRSQIFFKIGILKDFENFTVKHLTEVCF